MKTLKYQIQIDELISQGGLPPSLYPPENQPAFRFIDSHSEAGNHIPALIKRPSRRLPMSIAISGYALSCFDTEFHATLRYNNLKKSFKNISKTLGDALARGTLKPTDGLVTLADTSGHFDFYEYSDFDASATFVLVKQLS
ncbi:MAG: hypothetical protein IJU62_06975 [Muribaculaceae bacterium]|nr:hypothetical protein [Muribaculaceae bacterium]